VLNIAVDAMGGDRAPGVVVQGAVEAAREWDIPIILVGDTELISQELKRYPADHLPICLVHASEAVGMDELPSVALRKKKNSSIEVAIDLVKRGEASGFVSAGNTGVCMATAMFRLGMLKGVERPAIAALLPTLKGVTMLLDVGATVDCKPKHLHQFAIMGEVYARYVLKVKSPRVGILSIGEEDVKGNEVTKEAFRLLKGSAVDFIGNVEGKEVFKGKADVVVCDGFIGNVALKISESVAEMISLLLRREITKSWWYKAGFLMLKPAFRDFKKTVDYSEYGGAPLLGVNAPCIIAHGSSTAKAIKNAIKATRDFVAQKVNEHILEDMTAIMDLDSPITTEASGIWDRHMEKLRQAAAAGQEKRVPEGVTETKIS
jgi:glycerol-3-phosphate acyltransferase PlsX